MGRRLTRVGSRVIPQADDTMTDSFGARLRRERERRDISLQAIAERTKIKASLFEALERNDASRWPSGIFRRAFIRGYAEAVGLDADVVTREFLEQFPDPDAPAPPPAVSAEDARPQPQVAERHSHQAGALTPGTSDDSAHGLRLTLVDSRMPFTGGRFLAGGRQRWAAAAWDCGSILALAVTLFVCLDTFWAPLGLTALCYYVGGVLVLGNSPGVCLFAPRPPSDAPEAMPSPRATRPRHHDAHVRPADAAYRTHRVRATRGRQIHG